MGLAYVGRVIDLAPIKEADRIVLATVVCGAGGKWLGVVPKENMSVGASVRVFLQDAVVPDTVEFEFMKARRNRVKMCRFKGVPSECLIMPYTGTEDIGTDITDNEHVSKYEKPIPAALVGEIEGLFPSYIPKTDEPNFQTVPHLVEALRGHEFVATEKCDGTSGTFFRRTDPKTGVVSFGVCSRNLQMKNPSESVSHRPTVYWDMAEKYGLLNILRNMEKGPEYDLALQFEIVGPGIQKNPMCLQNHEIRLFNIRSIATRTYWNHYSLTAFAEAYKLPVPRVIDTGQGFNYTEDEMRKLAEGCYLDTKNQREGLVFRPVYEQRVGICKERLSFKVINLLYKD